MLRLALTIIPILCGIAIYLDVKKTGRPYYAFFISSIATFLFPIGPVLYLAARHKLIQYSPKNRTFCPKCGFSSNSKHSRCPKCKNTLKIDP